MEHAKRATVTVTYQIEWHEDDVGGSLEELDDIENTVTEDDLYILMDSTDYSGFDVQWDNIWYPKE